MMSLQHMSSQGRGLKVIGAKRITFGAVSVLEENAETQRDAGEGETSGGARTTGRGGSTSALGIGDPKDGGCA